MAGLTSLLQINLNANTAQSLTNTTSTTLGTFDTSTGATTGLLSLLIAVNLIKVSNTTSNGTITYSLDLSGSMFSNTITTTQSQISNNISNITLLQTNNNLNKTFLAAMVNGGYITFSGNVYSLTPAFMQTLSIPTNISLLQTDNNLNKTFLTAMVNGGFITLSGGAYSLTTNFIQTLTDTLNLAQINTIFKNIGFFSSDFTMNPLSVNLVSNYFLDYNSLYGNVGLMPPYRDHLYGYWITRNKNFLNSGGVFSQGTVVTGFNSAYDKGTGVGTLFNNIGSTKPSISGLDSNGKSGSDSSNITGTELDVSSGGLCMNNKILWNSSLQASVFTHCLLFRNFSDTYTLPSSNTTLISTDSNRGNGGLDMGMNNTGVYCHTGGGTYFFGATVPTISSGSTVNTVVLKSQKYYLLINSISTNVDLVYGFTGSITPSSGSGVPGTWNPSQYSGFVPANTVFQSTLYINGINCGSAACYPPESFTGSNSLLSLGSNNDGTAPSPVAIVNYSLYKFSFTQTEVTSYVNFIKKIYPNIIFDAPY